MRTFKSKEATFSYNADLSGEVIVTQKDGRSFTVLGHDLLDFVANYIRENRISDLEAMHWKEILEIK